MALFCLISQVLLTIILVYFNMSDIIKVYSRRRDASTLVGIIALITFTSIFFGKIVHSQYKNASKFNAVFQKVRFPSFARDEIGLRKLLLGINIFVNGVLGSWCSDSPLQLDIPHDIKECERGICQ